MNNLLAIDVGGTHQRFAEVNSQGKIVKKMSYKNSSYLTAKDFFGEFKNRIHEWIQKNKCRGIGMVFPIVMDEKTWIVCDAPNLSCLVGTSISQEFSSLPLPWVIENDANGAAMGEAWLGAGKKEASFCCLTLGTGVGGGLILNRSLWKGMRGMASEIGHIKIDASQQYVCACGDTGCLEAFISAGALYKNTGVSSKELYERAKEGDSWALSVFEKMGGHLGRAAASVANFLNIECFIIGGQLSGAFDFFYPLAIQTAKQSSMKGPGERIRIIRAELGDDAGLLGATFLIQNAISK